MKKKKKIIPKIRISSLTAYERRVYLFSVPISKFLGGVIIDRIEFVEGRALNVEERKAAFKVIGRKASSLVKKLLSYQSILSIEMYKNRIVILGSGRNSLENLDNVVLEEITKHYKTSGFTEVEIEQKGHGDITA